MSVSVTANTIALVQVFMNSWCNRKRHLPERVTRSEIPELAMPKDDQSSVSFASARTVKRSNLTATCNDQRVPPSAVGVGCWSVFATELPQIYGSIHRPFWFTKCFSHVLKTSFAPPELTTTESPAHDIHS